MEHRIGVGPHRAPPPRIAHLVDGHIIGGPDACIVHGDIEPPEHPDPLGDEGIGRGRITQIPGKGKGTHPLGTERGDQCLGVHRPRLIADADVGAEVGEIVRDGRADATGAPGDDRAATGEGERGRDGARRGCHGEETNGSPRMTSIATGARQSGRTHYASSRIRRRAT